MHISTTSRGPSPFSGTASYRPDPMSIDDELHPVIHASRVAVITGAASGIGKAAAEEFAKCVFRCPLRVERCKHDPARLGLKIAIADIDAEALKEVGKTLAREVGEANVLVVPTDVSQLEEVVRLRDRVYEAWGEVRIIASHTDPHAVFVSGGGDWTASSPPASPVYVLMLL